MGRRKKNATIEQDVENFIADKDGFLENFNKEKVVISQDVIDMFEIKPVARTPHMAGKKLTWFSGKSYKESLEMAYEWEDKTNKQIAPSKVKLVDYFPQYHLGKSIIVSFNLIEKGA